MTREQHENAIRECEDKLKRIERRVKEDPRLKSIAVYTVGKVLTEMHKHERALKKMEEV